MAPKVWKIKSTTSKQHNKNEAVIKNASDKQVPNQQQCFKKTVVASDHRQEEAGIINPSHRFEKKLLMDLMLPLRGIIVQCAHRSRPETIPRNRRPDFCYDKFLLYKTPFSLDSLTFRFEIFHVGLWFSAKSTSTSTTGLPLNPNLRHSPVAVAISLSAPSLACLSAPSPTEPSQISRVESTPSSSPSAPSSACLTEPSQISRVESTSHLFLNISLRKTHVDKVGVLTLNMPDSGGHKAKGRALPSWMSSRGADKNSEHEEPANEKDKRHASQTSKSTESSIGTNKFPKIMEGVVFVLSGFVNPERSTLRSQALEMGAEYQGDWNTNCTLLVCAFSNTPKFRQVEADNGTIVSKGWIDECYNQKQLVAIEPFLLHAGKPWRRQSSSGGPSQGLPISLSAGVLSLYTHMCTAHKPAKREFLTSEVKKWAIDDMRKTMSWLNSQDEKPDSSEIKKIAAEGILTCLQDAIDCLKEGRGLGKILEEWSFVPQVVEELNKLDTSEDNLAKKDIYHQAIACKAIYEFELGNSEEEKTTDKKKRAKIEKSEKSVNYDSDDTIEMTEDEIQEAFYRVASSIHK
ncbi:hypothetical protein E3N88_39563 [Mikania micrantha]|uniref:BRCT domain-containing protein n=1 Tax=Mikania micrantha TaxID=192012 RepID=A0A5N6LX52_9ASTR|nr:hypothetical protein E3N88_42497 [Mikania micrantha]KAD2806186.1 hypothetical protein E3N88_39563 [Mikania micrantha]